MKNLLALTSLSVFIASGPGQAACAQGLSLYSAGDGIDRVIDLPDTMEADYGMPGNVDIGWKHFKVTALGMPLFGASGGQYVLFEGDTHQDITVEQAQEIAGLIDRKLDAAWSPPIWSYWGWAVILPVLAGLAAFIVTATRKTAPP